MRLTNMCVQGLRLINQGTPVGIKTYMCVPMQVHLMDDVKLLRSQKDDLTELTDIKIRLCPVDGGGFIKGWEARKHAVGLYCQRMSIEGTVDGKNARLNVWLSRHKNEVARTNSNLKRQLFQANQTINNLKAELSTARTNAMRVNVLEREVAMLRDRQEKLRQALL